MLYNYVCKRKGVKQAIINSSSDLMNNSHSDYISMILQNALFGGVAEYVTKSCCGLNFSPPIDNLNRKTDPRILQSNPLFGCYSLPTKDTHTGM